MLKSHFKYSQVKCNNRHIFVFVTSLLPFTHCSCFFFFFFCTTTKNSAKPVKINFSTKQTVNLYQFYMKMLPDDIKWLTCFLIQDKRFFIFSSSWYFFLKCNLMRGTSVIATQLKLELSLPLSPSLFSCSCFFTHCEAAIFIITNIICINHQDKWLVWLSECLI